MFNSVAKTSGCIQNLSSPKVNNTQKTKSSHCRIRTQTLKSMEDQRKSERKLKEITGFTWPFWWSVKGLTILFFGSHSHLSLSLAASWIAIAHGAASWHPHLISRGNYVEFLWQPGVHRECPCPICYQRKKCIVKQLHEVLGSRSWIAWMT